MNKRKPKGGERNVQGESLVPPRPGQPGRESPDAQPDFEMESIGNAGSIDSTFIPLTPFLVCLRKVKANLAAQTVLEWE